jgi:hypothetical protein
MEAIRTTQQSDDPTVRLVIYDLSEQNWWTAWCVV